MVKALALDKIKKRTSVLGGVVFLVLLIVVILLIIGARDSRNNAARTAQEKQVAFNSDIKAFNKYYYGLNYSQALDILKSANDNVTTDSETNLVNFYYANIYLGLKQYNQALGYLLKIQNTDQGSPSVYAEIAGIYQKEGNKTNAISYYQKAINSANASGNSQYISEVADYQIDLKAVGGS